MNKTAILKAVSGLTYDELAISLNEMGIDITRSALAARASSPTGKFFEGDDYLNLTKGFENPTKKTKEFVKTVLDSYVSLGEILQLYFANTNEEDFDLLDGDNAIDVDSSDDFDDFDDFSELDDEQSGDEDAQNKDGKKSKSKKSKSKKKSKGGDASQKKKDKKIKSKKKDKNKKSKKKKSKKDKLDAVDDLLNNATDSKKKGSKKSKSEKDGKNEPWSDAADLREVDKADPTNDPGSFEDDGADFDDNDFDIDLDDL